MRLNTQDTRQGPIRFASAGRPGGLRVLFVHGAPGSWEDWQTYLEDGDLTSRFEMRAVNRLGHGRMKYARYSADFDEQADAVEDLCGDWPSEEKLLLVGHSYGGALVSDLAWRLESAGRLGGVLLISSVLSPELNRAKWFHKWVLRRPVFWGMPMKRVRAACEMFKVRDGLEGIDGLWERFPCPVGLIHGEADRLVPIANSEYAFRRLASHAAFFERVEGAGHALQRSHPELVKKALLAMADLAAGTDCNRSIDTAATL